MPLSATPAMNPTHCEVIVHHFVCWQSSRGTVRWQTQQCNRPSTRRRSDSGGDGRRNSCCLYYKVITGASLIHLDRGTVNLLCLVMFDAGARHGSTHLCREACRAGGLCQNGLLLSQSQAYDLARFCEPHKVNREESHSSVPHHQDATSFLRCRAHYSSLHDGTWLTERSILHAYRLRVEAMNKEGGYEQPIGCSALTRKTGLIGQIK